MRFSLTEDGLLSAAEQGVSRDEILHVLTGPGPRMVEDIDPYVRAITARTQGGRLVVVWLEESSTGEYDLETAFEAGFAVEVKWNHIYGGTQ
jgi:hypothetical protein